MAKGGKMREIKFRAWDKHLKFMIPDCQKQYVPDDVPLCCFNDYLTMTDRFDVMQYTGIKDKNGKEIYEGDILKHDNCWLATVGFDCGAFYWQAECYKPEAQDWQDATYRDFEVIGNIYENPELLKNEDKPF